VPNILPSHHIMLLTKTSGMVDTSDIYAASKTYKNFYLKHQVLCSGFECPVCGEPKDRFQFVLLIRIPSQ